MKLLAVGDYVIWKRTKLCKILKERLRDSTHFLGKQAPIEARYEIDIRPAGMTEEDHVQMHNDSSAWEVVDEATGEKFPCLGSDLIPIPEMMVIALMAKGELDG